MKIDCPQCGDVFSAPDDRRGQRVTCPLCGHDFVARRSSSATPPAPPPTGRLTGGDEDDEDELRLAPEESRPAGSVLLEPVPVSAAKPAPAKPAPAGPAGGQPRAGAGFPASRADCPNCGATLPPDGTLCLACGYHTVLKRVLQTDLDDLDLDMSTGFERWFGRLLAEGESGASLMLALHAVVILVGLTVGMLFHPHGWYVIGPLLLAYAGLVLWARQSRAYVAWGRSFWNLLLTVHRKTDWRRLSPPFPRRLVFTLHDPQFGDEQLQAVEGVVNYHVLDLEGTTISDAALQQLQYCERLECIVLKGTRVTPTGTLRLQIMKPQLAIWR